MRRAQDATSSYLTEHHATLQTSSIRRVESCVRLRRMKLQLSGHFTATSIRLILKHYLKGAQRRATCHG